MWLVTTTAVQDLRPIQPECPVRCWQLYVYSTCRPQPVRDSRQNWKGQPNHFTLSGRLVANRISHPNRLVFGWRRSGAGRCDDVTISLNLVPFWRPSHFSSHQGRPSWITTRPHSQMVFKVLANTKAPSRTHKGTIQKTPSLNSTLHKVTYHTEPDSSCSSRPRRPSSTRVSFGPNHLSSIN